MTNNINLNLEIKNTTKNKINTDIFLQNAIKLINQFNLSGNFIANLTIVGTSKIKSLNNKFLHKNYPTDVLSFPIFTKNGIINNINLDTPVLLGEIIICYDVAKKQALDKKHSIDNELNFLFLHGFKHLLGHHHKE